MYSLCRKLVRLQPDHLLQPWYEKYCQVDKCAHYVLVYARSTCVVYSMKKKAVLIVSSGDTEV